MESRTWTYTALVVVFAASIGAGVVFYADDPAKAQTNGTDTVEGSPELDVFLPQKTVQPGETTTINVQIRNDGRVTDNGVQQYESYVTTARDVEVSVESDSDDITVETGTTAVQNIPRGRPVTVPVTVSVPEDASGNYDLDVDIEYNYYQSVEYQGSVIVSSDRTSGFESEEVSLSVRDSPIVSATEVTSNATVGETGTATISLQNTGSQDMNNARLRLQSTSGSVAIDGGQQSTYYLGEVSAGEETDVNVPITFAQTADAASQYYLQATLIYENNEGQQRQAVVDNVFVSPEPVNTIIATQTETTAPIGGTGETVLYLENTGNDTLKDATVQVTSQTPAVLFAGQSSTTRIQVGDWRPNDEKRVPITTTITPDAIQTRYAVSVSVQYENDGTPNRLSVDGVGITPQPEQAFETTVVSSNVSEGEEGTVTLSFTNGGPKDVDDARLVLQGDSGLSITKRTFNLGSVGAGETVRVDVPAESPSNLDSLTQGIDVTVTYETDTSTRRQAEENFLTAQVQPAPETFDVTFKNSSRLAPGETRTMTVKVTNNRDSELQNLDAKFTGNGPVSVSRDTAFINTIRPNETRTINITVRAKSGALANTHPIEVDFQYEDSDGDSRLSKVYKLPVTVTDQPENKGPSTTIIIGGVGLVLVVLGSVAYYYRGQIVSALE